VNETDRNEWNLESSELPYDFVDLIEAIEASIKSIILYKVSCDYNGN